MLLLLACDEEVAATTPAPASTEQAPARAGETPQAPKAPARCGDAPATPAPKGCVTGEVLTCGAQVSGTTEGGDAVVDNTFYEHAFCFPRGEGPHDGPERVYRVAVPEYQQATISLDSPCVDLDLVAVAYDWTGSCPAEDAIVSECEADTHGSGGKLRIDVFNPREYLVMIDGKAGVVGPYTLNVACRPIRRPGDK